MGNFKSNPRNMFFFSKYFFEKFLETEETGEIAGKKSNDAKIKWRKNQRVDYFTIIKRKRNFSMRKYSTIILRVCLAISIGIFFYLVGNFFENSMVIHWENYSEFLSTAPLGICLVVSRTIWLGIALSLLRLTLPYRSPK